jgi:sulfate/thiosulfate transport system permease protein
MAEAISISTAKSAPAHRVRAGATEPRIVRWTLTGIAVLFLTLFIVLPAVNVFAQALSKGFGAYVRVLVPAKAGEPAAAEPGKPAKKPSVLERIRADRERATAEKTWAAIRMTLGVAAVVVPLNVLFGIAGAWAIAKFRFRGRSLLVTLIDLPFSVSPVVAGLLFVLLFGRNGWFGSWATNFTWPDPASIYWRGFSADHWIPIGFAEHHVGIIFTPLATVLASIFVTFPFVARSLIPLMVTQGTDEETAALSLGAGGFKTFWRVTLPNIKWGLLYGVILCTARALGEFGAVSVVAGDIDATTTMPLQVFKLWEGANNQAAFTVASLLASIALVTLVLKSILDWKTRAETRDRAHGVMGG